jgi:hypothetical protein
MERPVMDRIDRPNIFDRAVCLSLELHRLGTNRKMNVADLKPGVETDAHSIRVSKALLAAPELDAIKKADGELRRYLASKTSGPALFRNGVYMLAYAMVDEVDREVTTRLLTRANTLVPAFLDVYDQRVEDARRRLGVHFKAEEYPDKSTVAATFSAGVRYFTLGSPEGLEKIRADIFEREEQKAAAQWAEVLDESRNVLRMELAELVSHMVDRLQPDPSGKTKRFNSSLIENLDAFLADFAKRNIADDAELQAIVTEARGALTGITPKRLRESAYSREQVREKFTAVKVRLDASVLCGARMYDLD